MFLASEVRSGSTYSAEAIAYALADLKQCSFWDLAKEPLNQITHASDADDLRRAIALLWVNEARFRSGKILCAQLSILCREAARDAQLAQALFGADSYWLIVRRRDRLSQAVSLAFAREDGVFHAYAPDESEPAGAVSMDDIVSAFGAIALSEQFLELFAACPARVMSAFYEDIVADRAGFVRDVAAFIGMPVDEAAQDFAAPRLTRTRQAAKADTAARFGAWFLENYHDQGDPGPSSVRQSAPPG